MKSKFDYLEKHYSLNGNVPEYGAVDFFMWGNKNKKDYTSEVIEKIISYSESAERYIPIYNNIVLVLQEDDVELFQLVEKINKYFNFNEINIFVSCEVLDNLNLTSLVDFMNAKEDKTFFLVYGIENYYNDISTHILKHLDSMGQENVESNYVGLINNVYLLCQTNFDSKFLILDSDYMLPINEKILDPLYDIEKLSMNGLQLQDRKNLVYKLIKIMEEKGIAEVIAYIDKSNDIEDKDFLKLQFIQKLRLEKGENYTVRYIENILENIHISDSLGIEEAIIIADASLGIMKDSYTEKFIDYAVEKTMSYSCLEKAYDLANRMKNNYLINSIEIKLNKFFPKCKKLKYIQLNKYLSSNNFEKAYIYIKDDMDFSVDVKNYLEFNSKNSQMMFNDCFYFMKLTYEEIPNFYYNNFLIIKKYLFDKKEFENFYRIVKESDGKLKKYELFISKIDLVEEIFLLSEEEVEEKDLFNLVFIFFEDIFETYIVQDDLLKAYTSIERLLSHERSHSLGSIFLYKLLSKKYKEINFEIIDNNNYIDLFEQDYSYDPERLLGFYKLIFSDCLKDRASIVVDGSYFTIPNDIFGMSQKDVDNLIKFLFWMSINSIGEEGFLYTLNLNIYIIYNLAQKSSFKNVDLYFLNNIMNKLCVEGFTQPVRDMMLNLFVFAKDDLERRKIACLSYADISLRLKDPICALSHILFSIDEKIDIYNFYSFYEVTARTLRDLKLYNFALEFITVLENTLSVSEKSLYEKVYNKINFLKISIETNEIMKNKGKGYSKFVDQVLSFYESEVNSKNEIEPISLTLLQLYKFGIDNNLKLNEKFLGVIEGIRNSSKNNSFSKKISRLIFDHDFSVIFETYKEILNSNYSSNLEKDFVNFRMIIKSTLNSLGIFNPLQYAFMAEMLVDNTYSDINSNFFDKNIKSYEDLSDFSKNLDVILLNCDLYFMVLNQFHNLIVLHCSNGKIDIIDDLNFDIDGYRKWNNNYPRDYGYYDVREDGNLFYDSILKINIGLNIELKKNSVILIDPLIHSITPKVFSNNSLFWGNNKSISLSPSIRWLSNNINFLAQQSKNNILRAWISDDDSNGYLLNSLASNFSEKDGIFEKYGIKLDRTHALPNNISNSKLAIVAAHGSVSYTTSNFSTISDEGNLRVNYLDFAEKLHDCQVVILFVCNSGRFDPHPEYSTTISLQKELLNKGCSAVIASPWPLKGFMTLKWLPEFMKCWIDEKKSLQEAVFEANQCIDKYYGDPSDSLALTIYGNPFIKF